MDEPAAFDVWVKWPDGRSLRTATHPTRLGAQLALDLSRRDNPDLEHFIAASTPPEPVKPGETI